jgi:malonate transporter MadL subunit
MVVYGVALLAFCLLLGTYLGELLGVAIGVKANVGGVGIAMLLLIILSNLSAKKFHLKPLTESGIGFWSAMYIPIVVAMAAKQNVIAAVSSGWLAVIAGVGAVLVSFAMIPVLSRLAGESDPFPEQDKS